MEYHDYEKEIYNWLFKKHIKDTNFTFSVRKKTAKGAEKDYFIGTKNGGYFGTTFWKIQFGYEGASSDLIDLIFNLKNGNLNYHFEFRQTNNPHNEQNKLALELVKNLKIPISKVLQIQQNTNDSNNYTFYRSKSKKENYVDLSELLTDVSNEIDLIIPIVDYEINEIKKQNPTFIAERISLNDFNEMQNKLHSRIGIPELKVFNDNLEGEIPIFNNFIYPKNLILYGPPGTGKTYNTKRKAVEIIAGKELSDDNLDVIYEKYKSNIFFNTFHQSFAYEQFVEGIGVDTYDNQVVYLKKSGIFKEVCRKAIGFNNYKEFFEKYPSKEDRKKYFNEKNTKSVVLIIDEINRGNISKIFGELITLIEDDKRLGEENEIIVTLPYSGEQFGVPPNLYIIGTMNTADRSLVQLDTALRRRFDFEEMMPCYDENIWVVESEKKTGFDLLKFLKSLNDKICKEYDREHQIGHSFLMKVNSLTVDAKDQNGNEFNSLKRAWENKIMPLLQEYFYGDYDKLAKVIGDKSEYLKKIADNSWQLNMKVKTDEEFNSQFHEVYKFVTNEKPAASENKPT